MKNEVDRKSDEVEGCLAEPFLKFISQEWMSHIVRALAQHGTLRFGALRRALPPAISPRVLSARLKDLETQGYVEKRDLSERVRHVEYTLTKQGRMIHAALSQSESVLVIAGALPR